MSSASIHDKLSRVRKPRVHITYEVETEGARVEKELPFVVGVLGDFSGKPTEPLKPLKDRKFIQIDRDNFNDVMARMTPGPEPQGREHAQGRRQRDGRQAQVQLVEDFEPARSSSRSSRSEAARDPRQAPRPADQGRPLRGPGEPAGASPQEQRGAQETVGGTGCRRLGDWLGTRRSQAHEYR